MVDEDILTDEERDEEERKRKAQPDSIGTPIAPENARLIHAAGGMLGAGPNAPMGTESAKLPDTLAAPAAHESVGTPIQGMTPAAAPRPNYDRYQQQLHNKAGVENLHGFGGGLVKGLEAIGTALAPNRMAMIPGTRLHHEGQVEHARIGAEEENRQVTNQSEEQLREAQAEEQRALAKKNAAGPQVKFQPAVIAGPNGEPVAAGYNPQTNSYHNPDTGEQIMGAKKWEKPVTPPHGNDFDSYYAKWLKDNKQPDTAANQLKAHKEWETQGGKEPQGTWMPLYDEKGHVTGAWNAATGQHRAASPDSLPGRTAPGSHIATAADAVTEKKTAPLKAIIDEADKAQALKDAADKGNAEADVDLALTFFKTMRSAIGGSSGIRFTQQENNLIMGARSLWDSIEVKGNKIFSHGQPLSATQRQQIMEVINIHKQAAQRQLQEAQQGTAQAPPAGGAPPTSGGAFKPF